MLMLKASFEVLPIVTSSPLLICYTIYHELNILAEVAGALTVTLPFEDEFISGVTRESYLG